MRALYLISRTVSSGLGSGFSPIASGTAGSLLACVAWWLLVGPSGSVTLAIAVAAITSIVGIYATKVVINDPTWRKHSLEKGSHKGHLDPREVVIDEWAGMFVALVSIPVLAALARSGGDVALSERTNVLLMVAAFFAFRAFDVLKPGPVGLAERLPGEWGIMLDDVVAGLFAGICVTSGYLVFF